MTPISDYHYLGDKLLGRSDYREYRGKWFKKWNLRHVNKEFYHKDPLGSVILMTGKNNEVPLYHFY